MSKPRKAQAGFFQKSHFNKCGKWLALTMLAGSPGLLAQTPDADQFYASAKQAFQKGDCTSGVYFLKQYKILAAAKLAANPAFAQQIDNQIALCKPIVERGPTDRINRKIEIRGESETN